VTWKDYVSSRRTRSGRSQRQTAPRWRLSSGAKTVAPPFSLVIAGTLRHGDRSWRAWSLVARNAQWNALRMFTSQGSREMQKVSCVMSAMKGARLVNQESPFYELRFDDHVASLGARLGSCSSSSSIAVGHGWTHAQKSCWNEKGSNGPQSTIERHIKSAVR
jgi:hypothetical protein